MLHSAAEDQQVAADQREHPQDDHRVGHRARRLVRMDVVLPAPLAVEGHDERTRHVERGEPGAGQRDQAEDPARGAALVERCFDDLVLRPEPGRQREADDREEAAEKHAVGDRHDPGQPAEAAHVDAVVHGVHDRAGRQEQRGLEEAVADQVDDADRVHPGAEADGQEHVADLADGRVREHPLEVVLPATADTAVEQRDRPDHDDSRAGRLRDVEDRCGPGDQVDAGGDHCRRVDQRRHRGWALHRVGQPGLQRELAGLAARAEQQHEPDRGGDALGQVRVAVEHVGEGGAAEVNEHDHDRDGQADVAHAVGEERLVARRRCRVAVVVEGDQQVGREADALPADVHGEVAVGQHQQQHHRDEEVEVAEEAPAALVVGHVPDGVDVDQRADAGDQQHEHHRQRVDQQAGVDLEAGHRDPRVQVQVDRAVALPLDREEQHHGIDEQHDRDRGAHQVRPLVGAPAGDEQHGRGQQRQRDQQPGGRLDPVGSGHGATGP